MTADGAARSLGRFGVWSSYDRLTAAELIDFARLVEELGYDTLWVNESAGREPFAVLGALARATTRLTLGLGVASIYARDAVAAHAGARTLADLSGGRFVMGLGVSHESSAAVRGHEYEPPLRTMRTYLDGYAEAPYTATAPAAEPPLLLAALGPRMLELAAIRSDGAFGYLVTSGWARDARRVLDDAAAAAGRPARSALVVSQAAVLGSDRAAHEAARAAVEHHLPQPNYRRNMLRMGFVEADVSVPASDRLIDALVVQGDEGAIRARVEEMLDAGADHVALIPISLSGRHADPATTRAAAPPR